MSLGVNIQNKGRSINREDTKKAPFVYQWRLLAFSAESEGFEPPDL